jgi:hypothetical protein
MKELIKEGIMSEANYKRLASAGQFQLARNGKGLGCYALVVVDTLPDRFRMKVNKTYPDGRQIVLDGWVRSNYEVDQNAVVYFNDRSQTGVEMTEARKRECVVNASVLNCCIKLYENSLMISKLMGRAYEWSMMAATIESLRQQFGHTLPCSTQRFRKKVAEYKRVGYECLISGKFGNQSARKVSHQIEQLVLGLAIQTNQPYHNNVYDWYLAFIRGEMEVYDPTTGEAFDPKDFTDKDGRPQELSQSTINNILNSPKNQILIRAKLDSYTTFMHETMPHMHRHNAEFALSKVTIDDRDLPRKLKDTRIRPKAYYAYDMASMCCIGFAYNRKKNTELVVDMFRNMFRLLDRHGWGCPAEIEVEHHLLEQYAGGFLKAGEVFPYVHFCAPTNSQEKGAETFNGAKKRRIEHRNHDGIGRFYAKNKCYRVEAKKVFDEANDTYVDKQYYTWEELIADDLQDIMQFNNSLHPNQKKYPGMTRWQVLEANINPTLRPLDKATLARYIGEKVPTTIRRNSYCRVAHADWWLSSTRVLERLAPNNYEVDAYYIPDEKGEANEVYIFQDERLIDQLQNIGTYSTAAAEQTEEDKRIFVEQRKKVSEFRGYVKEHSILRVGMLERKQPVAMDEYEEALEVTPVARDVGLDLPPSSFRDYASEGAQQI